MWCMLLTHDRFGIAGDNKTHAYLRYLFENSFRSNCQCGTRVYCHEMKKKIHRSAVNATVGSVFVCFVLPRCRMRLHCICRCMLYLPICVCSFCEAIAAERFRFYFVEWHQGNKHDSDNMHTDIRRALTIYHINLLGRLYSVPCCFAACSLPSICFPMNMSLYSLRKCAHVSGCVHLLLHAFLVDKQPIFFYFANRMLRFYVVHNFWFHLKMCWVCSLIYSWFSSCSRFNIDSFSTLIHFRKVQPLICYNQCHQKRLLLQFNITLVSTVDYLFFYTFYGFDFFHIDRAHI